MKRCIIIAGILYLTGCIINAQSTASFLTDKRDGNNYRIVKIGDQVWMAENLKYLPAVMSPDTGSDSVSHFYVYGYDGSDTLEAKRSANYNTYGVLYNWPAAMNNASSSTSVPSGIQGVCPSDWHLPSDAEWTHLTDYLRTRVAGGKLKQKGTTLWDDPNRGASNKTGFTALPAGYRSYNGTFVSMGEDSDFWSATEFDANNAWFRNIYFNDNDVGRNNFRKEIGFSVRCVKN